MAFPIGAAKKRIGLQRRDRAHHRGIKRLRKIHQRTSDPDAVAGKDADHVGRIDLTLLKRVLPFDDYDFYLCGPQSFKQDIYNGLRRLKIADERIHAEAFGPSSLRRSTDK